MSEYTPFKMKGFSGFGNSPVKDDKKPKHDHPHEGRRRLDPNRIKGTWTSETNWISDDEEKTKIFDKVAKYHSGPVQTINIDDEKKILDKKRNKYKELLRKPEKKDQKKDD